MDQSQRCPHLAPGWQTADLQLASSSDLLLHTAKELMWKSSLLPGNNWAALPRNELRTSGASSWWCVRWKSKAHRRTGAIIFHGICWKLRYCTCVMLFVWCWKPEILTTAKLTEDVSVKLTWHWPLITANVTMLRSFIVSCKCTAFTLTTSLLHSFHIF